MDSSWGLIEGDPIIVTAVVATITIAGLGYLGQRLWQLFDERKHQGRPKQ